MLLVPGVHRFETRSVNWYVIEQDGRLTVVDAGYPGHYRVFRDGLTSLGRRVADVEAVILTHPHADHTGFAPRLAEEARCPVFIHEADAPGARRILNMPWAPLLANAWRPQVRKMLLNATLDGIFRTSTLSEVTTFRHGQTLDVPGRPVVVHTPGHTSGSACFLLPKQNVLFTGDTLVTVDFLDGQCKGPELPQPKLNDSLPTACASLEKLRDLGAITLLPGHGDPWRGDAAEAIENAYRVAGVSSCRETIATR